LNQPNFVGFVSLVINLSQLILLRSVPHHS
jgi:hypothetical protein